MSAHAAARLVSGGRAEPERISVSFGCGSRRIRTFSANPEGALLDDLAGYVASGALRPVVSSVFSLADIAAAHQAFGQGGILGKHVIAVAAA